MIRSCLLDSLNRMLMFGIIFEPVTFIWCVSLYFFLYAGMLLHAFADGGSCMSDVCSLHASAGCLVAGIHVKKEFLKIILRNKWYYRFVIYIYI